MRLFMGAVLSALLGLFFSQSAAAQVADNPDSSPCLDEKLVKAGTVEGEISVVGFLVGVRWGSGTLTLNDGRAFQFRMKGMKTLEVAVAKMQYSGTVYNLNRVEDFAGTYIGLGSGFALVKGLGAASFGNGKCVIVNTKAKASGVRLTSPLGPGGVQVEFVN